MSGTVEHHQEEVICPVCETSFQVLLCTDYNPSETPPTVTGIAGGTVDCLGCGEALCDGDLLLIE